MTTHEKKIVLVDDHVIVRNGLKELIEKLGPYRIIGEYDNGRSFIDNFMLVPAPDLIIMDISMPEMDGDEAISILNERAIAIPVLILTLNQDDHRMVKLFRLGVRGYLQKNCSAPILKEALSEIIRCGYYHNEFLAFSLQDQSTKQSKKNPQDQIIDLLTEREREFLRLVCHEKEYTYDQIAGLMNVQHRTVDGYRESIFQKFGIKSKTGLVLFILKHNLFGRL
jgi:two-component system, NarL family, invasion response regulator UvrY